MVKTTMRKILVLYIVYYFVLIGALIGQILQSDSDYANFATIAVTASHFVVGFVETLYSSSPIVVFVIRRYTKTYNVAADIIITTALILACIGLQSNDTWLTYTPLALALVGNTGCLYGRIDFSAQPNSIL